MTLPLPRTGVALFSALALSFGITSIATAEENSTPAPSPLQLAANVGVGNVARDIAVDEKSGRAYVQVDRLDEANGALTWLDTATNTPSTTTWDIDEPRPATLLLTSDQHVAMLSDSSSFFLLNPTNGSIEAKVANIDKHLDLLTETDNSYFAYTSSKIYRIDKTTMQASEKLSASMQRYPLYRTLIKNPDADELFVLEAREGVLTKMNAHTGEWIKDYSVPINSHEFDGSPLGGRMQTAAYDPQLHHLYIAIEPKFSDSWTNSKIVTFNTLTNTIVGKPIEVGERVLSVAVNPATHEVYTANSFSNTISAISPQTWTAHTAFDFNAAGITNGTGAGAANLSSLAVSRDGTTIYASHPYSEPQSTLSVLHRTGAVPSATPQEGESGVYQPGTSNDENNDGTPAEETTPGDENTGSAPGTQPEGDNNGSENTPTDNPQPSAQHWKGETSVSSTPAPANAQTLSHVSLTWGISDYTAAWNATPELGASVNNYVFTFGGENASHAGWYDPTTGNGEFTVPGSVFFEHYSFVPNLATQLGNFRLTVQGDGSGEISADVQWTDANGNASPYERHTLATFANAQIVRDGDSLTISATPDFDTVAVPVHAEEGKPTTGSWNHDFVNFLDESMRAWWYSTGASMDKDKKPLPFTLTAALTPASPAVDPEKPTDQENTTEPAEPSNPSDTNNQAGTGDPVNTDNSAQSGNPTKPSDEEQPNDSGKTSNVTPLPEKEQNSAATQASHNNQTSALIPHGEQDIRAGAGHTSPSQHVASSTSAEQTLAATGVHGGLVAAACVLILMGIILRAQRCTRTMHKRA